MIFYSCEDLIGLHWVQFPTASNFYDDIVIAEVRKIASETIEIDQKLIYCFFDVQTGCVVTLVGWSMSVLILIIRMFSQADFTVNVGTTSKTSIFSDPSVKCIRSESNASESGANTGLASSSQSHPSSQEEVQRLV